MIMMLLIYFFDFAFSCGSSAPTTARQPPMWTERRTGDGDGGGEFPCCAPGRAGAVNYFRSRNFGNSRCCFDRNAGEFNTRATLCPTEPLNGRLITFECYGPAE